MGIKALFSRFRQKRKEIKMQREAKTLAELQGQIKEWSVENFGVDQTSPVTGRSIGSLAPLLGIGEEIGELLQAETVEGVEDAAADAAIYLMDFCGREGCSLAGIIEKAPIDFLPPTKIGLERYLSIAYGCLIHAVLKRHQGIRGFSETPVYTRRRDEAIALLYRTLALYTMQETGKPLFNVAKQTWETIVSRRDWKRSPKSA